MLIYICGTMRLGRYRQWNNRHTLTLNKTYERINRPNERGYENDLLPQNWLGF